MDGPFSKRAAQSARTGYHPFLLSGALLAGFLIVFWAFLSSAGHAVGAPPAQGAATASARSAADTGVITGTGAMTAAHTISATTGVTTSTVPSDPASMDALLAEMVELQRMLQAMAAVMASGQSPTPTTAPAATPTAIPTAAPTATPTAIPIMTTQLPSIDSVPVDSVAALMQEMVVLMRLHVARMATLLADSPTTEELADMQAEMEVLRRIIEHLATLAQSQPATSVGLPTATPDPSVTMPDMAMPGMETTPAVTPTATMTATLSAPMSGMGDMGGMPMATITATAAITTTDPITTMSGMDDMDHTGHTSTMPMTTTLPTATIVPADTVTPTGTVTTTGTITPTSTMTPTHSMGGAAGTGDLATNQAQSMVGLMLETMQQMQSVMASGTASPEQMAEMKAKLDQLRYMMRAVMAQTQGAAAQTPTTPTAQMAAKASAAASSGGMMGPDMMAMMESMMGAGSSADTSMAAMSPTLPADASSASNAATSAVTTTTSLERSAEAGGVTVTVLPLNLGNAGDGKLDFQVKLETHTVNLDQDLTTLSVLYTPAGTEIGNATWSGPAGGHHIQGTLSFSTLDMSGAPIPVTGPGTLTLTLRDFAGVPERTFTWELS